MVFRKPYAFFIKNFRLMHIILTVCCVYLLIKTSGIVNFLSDYNSSNDLVIGQSIVSTLYSPMMFFIPFLILIFLSIILVVMIVKEKPKTFYIINIAVYFLTFILLIYGRGVISSMEREIVEPRTIKTLYDLHIYSLVFQVLTVVATGVRGIGFDIKKFDFSRDLQALDVSSEDNEEFEVSIDFDINDTKRRLKRSLRHMRYSYVEHRLSINIIICAIILAGGLLFYKNSSLSIKKYNQNSSFTMNSFRINVTDSYLVNTDYAGEKLNTKLLVLKVKLNCYNRYSKKLVTGAFALKNGDKIYHHTNKYTNELKDLGNVYIDQDVNDESYYLLVFDIGKDKLENPMLKVSNILSENYVYVKIKYNNLTGKGTEKEYQIGEELSLEDGNNNIKLKINEYEIADKFTINYEFCVKQNCIDSVEYLRPDYYNSDADLSLVKLNVNFESNNSQINNLVSFLSSFGRLEYTIDGVTKKQDIPFKGVKSKKKNNKSVYYIETLKEVENADSIRLVFSVRSSKYVYNIK